MIHIVGAGLAGCEAAWQAANLGAEVCLYEMKPNQKTPAHRSPLLAELVCSNSLRAARIEKAVGLLKYEMRRLSSLILDCADRNAVPAGGALAVDRDDFSKEITEKINSHPRIHLIHQCVEKIPEEDCVVLATGPLTQGGLFEELQQLFGQKNLYFFDAAAPVVARDSLQEELIFAQSRYNRGGADYLNCPLNKEEYLEFYEALIHAEEAEVEEFDRKNVFEGCMPIEVMAKRGVDTMRFGPLKPMGLIDPRTGKRPYAVVQLRQDDRQAEMYNLVGFQTRLKQNEQKRIFSMIPGLGQARFLRYGVLHRNTYLHAPGQLSASYSCLKKSGLFVAGQMTGVEGYVESAASGLVAGINAALYVQGKKPLFFPAETVIGSMAAYISDPQVQNFQPMNANWGLLPSFEEEIQKHKKNEMWVRRAVNALEPTAQFVDSLRIKDSSPPPKKISVEEALLESQKKEK